MSGWRLTAYKSAGTGKVPGTERKTQLTRRLARPVGGAMGLCPLRRPEEHGLVLRDFSRECGEGSALRGGPEEGLEAGN